MADLSGSYFPFPEPALKTLTLAAFDGTGILMTTLFAKFECSKIDRSMISYSILFSSGNSYTIGVTLKGKLMFYDTRYVITSNSPSGGMNVIDLSSQGTSANLGIVPCLTPQSLELKDVTLTRGGLPQQRPAAIQLLDELDEPQEGLLQMQ